MSDEQPRSVPRHPGNPLCKQLGEATCFVQKSGYDGPGRYRHYTGAEYEVLGVGVHESTYDEYVVYRSVENGTMWIRTLESFNSRTDWPAQNMTDVPRFQKIWGESVS